MWTLFSSKIVFKYFLTSKSLSNIHLKSVFINISNFLSNEYKRKNLKICTCLIKCYRTNRNLEIFNCISTGGLILKNSLREKGNSVCLQYWLELIRNITSREFPTCTMKSTITTKCREATDVRNLQSLRFEEHELLPDIEEHGDLKGSRRILLKVMSYNVLSQHLLDLHKYLYKNCPSMTLKWHFRFPRILSQIIEQNPDILCLQEVEESHIDSFYDKLEDLGYVSIFKKKTGKLKADGCAIYFRKNMFDLISESKVEYFREGVSRLNRDNVAIVVNLKCKASNKSIIVANTHLLYNPRRVDVRLAQIQLLLSEIYRMTDYGKLDSLIILTGDLNSLPDSPVVKLITDGSVTDTFPPLPTGIAELPPCPSIIECSESNLNCINSHSATVNNSDKIHRKPESFSSQICHDFKLQSVYPFYSGNQTEATTFQDEWITVDYIFYSNSDKLELQSRLRLPTSVECKKFIKFLPNYANPSDHLPLVATFLLNVD